MNWTYTNDIGSNTADLIKFAIGGVFTALGWLFNRLVKHWDELQARVTDCEADVREIKTALQLDCRSEKAESAKA